MSIVCLTHVHQRSKRPNGVRGEHFEWPPFSVFISTPIVERRRRFIVPGTLHTADVVDDLRGTIREPEPERPRPSRARTARDDRFPPRLRCGQPSHDGIAGLLGRVAGSEVDVQQRRRGVRGKTAKAVADVVARNIGPPQLIWCRLDESGWADLMGCVVSKIWVRRTQK
jgi:hypothetical protein